MSKTETKKKCPYCAEIINKDAIKCRYCGSWLDRKDYLKEWTRSPKDGKLLGICAGIARQLGISVTLVRLAFIIAAFFGYGILIYLCLWILMPREPEEESD